MTIGSCALAECIEIGAKEIGWSRRTPWQEKTGRYRRGLGMCCLMQGSSVPEVDMGAASIKMNEDGSFNLLIGATDLGTGSDTVLAQIAAEAIGTTIDKMIVYSSDTDFTPFDVGAYASSTTYLSGEAARKAGAKVKLQILDTAAEMLHVPVEELDAAEGRVFSKDGQHTLSFSGGRCLGEGQLVLAVLAQHEAFRRVQFLDRHLEHLGSGSQDLHLDLAPALREASPLRSVVLDAYAPTSNGVKSVSESDDSSCPCAAIWPGTMSLPVPRSVAPMSRLKEPSSFILILAAPMSTSGTLEPCIRAHMPSPRRKRPVFSVPGSAGSTISLAPISMHSPQRNCRWSSARPSCLRPGPRRPGELSPDLMWLSLRNSTGSMPIASAISSIRHSTAKEAWVAP